MGSLGGSLGSTLGEAGTALANAPSNVYAQSGLGDVVSGLQSLFGGGETVPTADFVGPPSPYAPPNFAQALVRGITGQNVVQV